MDYIDIEKAEALKNYSNHGAIDIKRDLEKGESDTTEPEKIRGESPWHYRGLLFCMVLAYVEAVFLLLWTYVLGMTNSYEEGVFTIVMAVLMTVIALSLWAAMVWKASCVWKGHQGKSRKTDQSCAAKGDADFEDIEFKDKDAGKEPGNEPENEDMDSEEYREAGTGTKDTFLDNIPLIALTELALPLYFYAPWTLLVYGGTQDDVIAGVLIALPCVIILVKVGKFIRNLRASSRAKARDSARQSRL